MAHALVTGGAGFIGSHVCDRLLSQGWNVTVVDSFDPFYDPRVKERNVQAHVHDARYSLVRADIRDMDALREGLGGAYDCIVHLAARAGVRPSIEQPLLYEEVNVRGTLNLLELARQWEVPRFVFGSSSSVYGVNPRVPWREDDSALEPISPYAATKLSGEMLARVFSHLHGLPVVCLRLFTVYGPRQRPDLAIHRFARLMLEGQPIPMFGDGTTARDYTYVDDVVSGIQAAMGYEATGFEIINLGNDRTVALRDMIDTIAGVLGVSPRIDRMPEQAGDVPVTRASIDKARRLLGYEPDTDFRAGVESFVGWLRQQDPVG